MKDLPNSESVFFRNATCVCGGIVAALGGLGLLGWISGWRVLASINPNYIPMAPDTAAIFIVFGSVLLIGTARLLSSRTRTVVGAVVVIASTYGLLKSIGYVAKLDLTFENTLFPVTEKLGSFPLARMSPITGLLFLLSGGALLLILWNKSHALARNLAGGLGTGVFIAGFVATIGYLFGTPLLYGGEVIPLAATTAIAFLLLGAGLVVAGGPQIVFIRPLVGPAIRARMLRAFLPLIVIAVLVEGLVHEVISAMFEINGALLSTLFTLIFVVITAAVVTRVAQIISRAIERSELERQRAENELAQERNLLRTVIDNLPDQIFAKDAAGKYILNNQSHARMVGTMPETMLGKTDDDFYSLAAAARYRADDRTVIQSGKAIPDYEDILPDQSGQEHWVLTTKVPLRDGGGQVVGIVGINRDISERKRAEEKYRTIFDHAVEGIFQSTPEGRFISANTALARMLGYATPQELLSTITDIAQQVYPDPAQRAQFRRLIEEQGEVREFEFQARRKDGSLMWVLENARAVRDINGVLLYYEGTTQNIDDRKQTEKELQYLSTHDALTGLYNRAFLEAELARLDHGRLFPVSVVMADLNGLKRINDSQGHAAGDELLRQAAQVFKTVFRAEDIVARIGGDEFAVLLPNADATGAADALARIRKCLVTENSRRQNLPLSFALGAASANGHGQLMQAMEEADGQMYLDKSAQVKSKNGTDV